MDPQLTPTVWLTTANEKAYTVYFYSVMGYFEKFLVFKIRLQNNENNQKKIVHYYIVGHFKM